MSRTPNIALPARRALAGALAVFCGLIPGPGQAAGDLVPGGTGEVAAILSGDALRLASGDIVRLAGIEAPRPARKDGKGGVTAAWPLAGEAKTALESLVAGNRVRLSYGGRRVDRYGRLLAHLHTAGGLWVQAELLSRGLARVNSYADNRAMLAEMLLFERQARAARRGIWALRRYAVRDVKETPKFLNSFQIVEGRVQSAAKVRGRVYLNFGSDWRRDFTVTLPPRAARLFGQVGRDPLSFEGNRIRIRGWLKPRNGPMITVTHPEQIEVLKE